MIYNDNKSCNHCNAGDDDNNYGNSDNDDNK